MTGPNRKIYACLLLIPSIYFSACAGSAPTGGDSGVPGKPEPAGSPPKAAAVYVALGDSTGVGLGARNGGGYVDRLSGRMRRLDPAYRLVNLCTARAASADVLNDQVNRFPDLHAAVVTISIGTNDLMQGVGIEEFIGNYEKIIERLKGRSAAIVITSIPDIASAPVMARYSHENIRSRVELFNRRIEETAGRLGVLFVDLYMTSGRVIRSRPDFFSADGFHPSDAGYEFWAETMWPAVEKAINEPPRK